MKLTAVCFVCVMVMCLFTGGQSKDCDPLHSESDQSPKSPGSIVHHRCAEYKCTESGSWIGKTCATSTCKKLMGYTETDYSKPFPECCSRPICG